MSIIQNKDIYDSSQPNPFESIQKVLELLDKKAEEAKKSLLGLENALRKVNTTGDGDEAKKLIDNTKKLADETEKLTAIEKAQLAIEQQLEKAKAKLAVSQSDGAKQLAQTNKQIRENNKALTDETNAYISLVKATNDAQVNYKKLAAEFGTNSKEAKSASKEFKNLDDQLRKINNSANDGRRDVGRYGLALKDFGKNMLGAVGIVGAFDLLVNGIKSAINIFRSFEKSISRLSSITGLGGKDLGFMADEAQRLGQEYGKSAKDIVDAYTLIGSQRPELLKNAQALAMVTDNVLLLSQATGLDLSNSASAVTALLSQFNLAANDSNRVVNALAAGSLEGSAEVDNITESMKNYGTVAKNSNLTVEQTIALIEILGEKQIFGVEAGTKLRGATLKLKEANLGYASGLFNMKDALTEANANLEKFGTASEKDAYLQKVFGTENITVGQILLENIGKFDKLTLAVTGTNVASEQAAKMMNNLSGDLDKADSAWSNFILSVESGDGIFSRVLRNMTQGVTGLINILSGLNKGESLSLMRERNSQDVSGSAKLRIEGEKAKLKGIEDETKRKQVADAIISGYEKQIGSFEMQIAIAEKEVQKVESEKNLGWGKTLSFLTDKVNNLKVRNEINQKVLAGLQPFGSQLPEQTTVSSKDPIINSKNSPVELLGKTSKKDKQKEADDLLKIEIDKQKKLDEIETKRIEKEKSDLENSLEESKKYDKLFLDEIKNHNAEIAKLDEEKLKVDLKKIEDQKKRHAELAEIVVETAAFAGEQVGLLIASGQLSFKEFSKNMLLMTLDVVRRELQIIQVKILAKALSESLFAGAAIAAAKIFLINTAFSAAKATIQSFAGGTESVEGAGTETSDSIPARLSKNERVVPANINKQLHGIKNKDLPMLISKGLQTEKMEQLLTEMKKHSAMTAFYLSNGQNNWSDSDYDYVKNWRNGEITLIPKRK